jgi:membrane protein
MEFKHHLVSRYAAGVRFLKSDIWRIQTNELAPRRRFWITQLRVFSLAVRRFFDDQCDLRASALTFYSLLSIVPVVAMAFAIAKGFGFEKILAEQLLEKLQGHEEIAERIIGFAQSLLENTRGGAIAGVGVVVLFWTIIKVLGNIESSFNDIWGVKTPRTMGRKLADYLSVMLICPILLIAASSVTVLVSTRVTLMVAKLAFLGYLADVIVVLLKILPYGVIWLVFTFLYVFMPNAKIELRSALWGGVIAGTIYQFVQLAYISFQIGAANYGAIYGSFAALPLFLAWMQLSWLIVLFGAEVSYAHQNGSSYEFEEDCSRLSHCFKRRIAVMAAHVCVRKFVSLEPPPTAAEIAATLGTPLRLARAVLAQLTEARLVSATNSENRPDVGYQPSRDIDGLTIAGIIDVLDHRGGGSVPIKESPTLEKVKTAIQAFHHMNAQSPANQKLREL